MKVVIEDMLEVLMVMDPIVNMEIREKLGKITLAEEDIHIKDILIMDPMVEDYYLLLRKVILVIYLNLMIKISITIIEIVMKCINKFVSWKISLEIQSKKSINWNHF